jgi:surface antigen
MRKIYSIAAIAVVAAGLGACTAREERVGGGALLGAGAGALIGAAATGRAGGALAGAAIGAVGGAVIADATRPRRQCVRVRYDAYGNAYCTRYRYLD